MNSEYGSKWRRWDLHIHTPGTKKNDQYEGSTIEEKWDNFYEKINDYIGNADSAEKDIVAIGITDYLSIDNYLKVIKERERLPKSIKLLLPNVEMRLNIKAKNSPVNIHFIFDPDIVDKLEDDFFSKLKFYDGEKDYIATRSSLISLGKSIDDKIINDDKAYERGIKSFVVSTDNIREIFNNNKELKAHTLIAVANSEKDGASGVCGGNEAQMQGVKNSIYKLADIIFSGNDKDRKFFSIEKKNPEEFIKKFGSIKPCIHGSDAHCLNKLFEPDKKRYCWIKADPTFNGLRQILYEPIERVYISSEYPEKKDLHKIIKSIEINDENFQSRPIVFNEGLNCIIGGKSTGKSLLLHEIVNSINPNYCKEQEKYDDRKSFQVEGSTVTWADGTNDPRKVIYIPQNYLNRIVDNPEEKTDINEIIENILRQMPKIDEAYKVLIDAINKISRYNNNLINDLKELKDKERELKSEIDFYGDSNMYKKTILELESKKVELSNKYNIKEEDIKKFNKIEKTKSKLENKLKSNNDEILYLSKLPAPKISISGISELDELKIKIPFSKEIILNKLNYWENNLENEWKNEIDKILKYIKYQNEYLKKKSEDINIKYKRLKNIVEKNEEIQGLNVTINKEKEKFEAVKEYERKNKNIQDEIKEKLKEIFSSSESYKKAYEEFCDIVKKEGKRNDTNLIFDVEYIWQRERFSESIKEKLNNRKFTLFKENYNYDLLNLDHDDYNNKLLNNIWDAIMKEELIIKNQYNKEDILKLISNNWYNIHYIIKSDHDTIEDMSPGKKALVLLEVLINLDNSKCPILIDQPEDDLDNRSIYNDLVQYLKNKKKERQIIIVSHNANVVIGADAEEIIIANQDGKDCENNKSRFEYRSGAIENDNKVYDESKKILKGILNQKGLKTQICEILEGGELAFKKRHDKYISNI